MGSGSLHLCFSFSLWVLWRIVFASWLCFIPGFFKFGSFDLLAFLFYPLSGPPSPSPLTTCGIYR